MRGATIEVRSMGGDAHSRAVIFASLIGMSCGFDTSIVAGISSKMRIILSVRWRTLLGAFAAGRSGDRCGSRDMLRVVGSMYLIWAPGSALASALALAWQLFVRRILILHRCRHRWIFNARSAAPQADRTGASTRCIRRIVPTLNFMTGILLADDSNFFRRGSEGAMIWVHF
jgi:hypothetical protein